ncbi:PREDICTED: uncharacterized protein LOC105949285 [Erythranthe guttata]|uniref:uncharacterized protein LOC105949285 n=1 Tax=Erythranthe guttata TaxID=4155 RepID=UPI00064DF965|nr:PREDICTED: uncharacterized protein LOC105949285 [Erythranthe guttata]|eukprot:XP_012828024.1 PREDICTED: uncharacterized protein LOC105949285 [Erythranthe guttata]
MWSPGVPAYDATSKQMFNMRAALMWTISDLPGYSNLSGWNVKTEYGCPCCCLDTHSKYLKYGKKYCFRGHRRFLDENHKFRDDSISFDGNVEYGYKPTRAYGNDLISELNDVITVYGKRISLPLKKKKLDGTSRQHNWKKKSILFELPYWKDNLIRHNLDIMHIEKNVCDNIMWTVLGIKGKSKDNLNARLDLQDLEIINALHPQLHGNGKAYLPSASNNFRQLYSKVSRASDFEALEQSIALTLCHLERIFPPAFFDLMEHLPIHLAEEAKLVGPVQYRSMFPIERYLCTLKNYVRTRSRPEGSIAEGCLVEECMNFCSRYLGDVESIGDRSRRNYEGFENICKEKVSTLEKSDRNVSQLTDEVRCLARGPDRWAKIYSGYVINGFSWVDNNAGVREDEFKFTLVNFNHLLYKHNRISDEPFVLASQAQQVWYAQDPIDINWHVVVKTIPRDLIDMRSNDLMGDIMENEESGLLNGQSLNNSTTDCDERETWVRTDVEGSIVLTSEIQEFEINRMNHQDDLGDEDEYENDNEEDLYYSDDEETNLDAAQATGFRL